MNVVQSWQQVETWLSENAPNVLERLPPGASEASLAEAEAVLGFALPPDLRTSQALHDGNAGAFWLHEDQLGALMSLDEIVRTWRLLVDLFGEGDNDRAARPPRGVKRRWFHRRWVPFLHPDMGDKTCIDLDPARGGTLGQVFYWSHTGGPESIVAPSYEALFAVFAQELAEGRYVGQVGHGGLVYLERREY